MPTTVQVEELRAPLPAPVMTREGVSSARVKTFTSVIAAHVLVDAFGGVWPVFKKLAGLDLFWAGMIATAAGMAGLATQPLFGVFAENGRRRRLIVCGLLLVSMSGLLGPIGFHKDAVESVLRGWFGASFGTAAVYGMLFLIFTPAMLGLAMFHPPSAALASNLGGRRHSTSAGVYVAAGMLGFAASQYVFATVYLRTGGHTEWLLLLLLPVLAGIFLWCDPRESEARRVSVLGVIRELSEAWRQLLVVYLILVMSNAANMGFFFLLPELLELRGHPAWLVNGGGAGLIVVGSAVTMIGGGYVADRFGRKRTLTGALAAALIAYYCLVRLSDMPSGAYAVLCLLTGGFLFTALPLGLAMGQQLAPKNVSTISGVMIGLAGAVGSISPWVVGALAKQPGIGPVGALHGLGVVLMVGVSLCCVLPSSSALRSMSR